jgi:hypothetical protein
VRRLPIEEQQLRTADGVPARYQNLILNVDSVVAALLAVHGGSSWAAALDAAVPMRKRLPIAAAGKTGGSAGSSGNGNDNDDAGTAHASSSGDDTAGAGACAADTGPAYTAGSGVGHEPTCPKQQGDEHPVETADAAAFAKQSNTLKQQRQPH